MPLRMRTPHQSHDTLLSTAIPTVFGHLESSRLHHDSPSCRAGGRVEPSGPETLPSTGVPWRTDCRRNDLAADRGIHLWVCLVCWKRVHEVADFGDWLFHSMGAMGCRTVQPHRQHFMVHADCIEAAPPLGESLEIALNVMLGNVYKTRAPFREYCRKYSILKNTHHEAQ